MANLVEVNVPDIGDFTDIPVIEILVKPGDTIMKEDSLVSLESDKATMEVPSTHSGVVKELKVKLGDKVSMGSVILVLEESVGATAAPSPTAPNVRAACQTTSSSLSFNALINAGTASMPILPSDSTD